MNNNKSTKHKPLKVFTYKGRAKGKFSAPGDSWSSSTAWCILLYYPQDDQIRIVKTFYQRSAKNNRKASPWFGEESMEILHKKAKAPYSALILSLIHI
eukprot:TRINITY_DN22937_c0_g1_i1.p1 TRINITY_DN22937_c0_g1~~TRINITY_DN22937_c0_g1_i1.p1  ORF type:complete len:106 (+),score=6.95 TRINITY_DN22937_c0_g1_i1:26-319(+)